MALTFGCKSKPAHQGPVRRVVTLNPSGRMVWEALETDASLDDLEALFRDVFPDADTDTLRRDVGQILDTLVEVGLVATTGNER